MVRVCQILVVSFLILFAANAGAVSVGLDNGGNNFGPGDALELSVSASNDGAVVNADGYLVLVLPDGTPLFFEALVSGLSVSAGTSDPSTWKKLFSNVALPAVFDTGRIPLLNFTFTGGEPPGDYLTVFAIVTAGTLDVLDAEAKSFKVLPYPVAGFLGSYAGSWTNRTFGSTGPVQAQVSDTVPGLVTISIIAGGAVFGGGQESFTVLASLSPEGGILSGGSPSFGTVSGTIGTDGGVQGIVTSVPGGFIQSIVFSGTLSDGSLNLAGTVNFVSGPPATGAVTATKQ